MIRRPCCGAARPRGRRYGRGTTVDVFVVEQGGRMPVVVMRVPAGTPPESLPIDHWVVACDVDAYDGRGRVWLTDSVELAEPFADAAAALTYWKRISTVRPLRPDGKPNRPLSAYTIQIERV